MLIVLKSGSLNFLEPSGPVQACNGIALPFFLNVTQDYKRKEFEIKMTAILNIRKSVSVGRSFVEDHLLLLVKRKVQAEMAHEIKGNCGLQLFDNIYLEHASIRYLDHPLSHTNEHYSRI